MTDSFKLPGSSYEEIVKIIKAYASGKAGQAMSLEILSQTSGIDTTTISRNNGFLMQLELISDGKNKTPTDIGVSLGRAYNLNITDEIKRIWNEIVDSNEFLGRMLSAIKIRGGMDKSSLISHILYSSGTNSTSTSKAGANTIINILKSAGVISEEDGKIKLIENIIKNDSSISSSQTKEVETVKTTSPEKQGILEVSASKDIQVNINININTSGENLEEITEKIKNLIDMIKA